MDVHKSEVEQEDLYFVKKGRGKVIAIRDSIRDTEFPILVT